MTIIETASTPTNTLSFDLTLWKGESSFRRNLGQFTAIYSTTATQFNTLSITAGNTLTVNCKVLMVSTDTPITITCGTVVYTVNSFIFIDYVPTSTAVIAAPSGANVTVGAG